MKVSVIIPTYNYGHFIGEAIESVRSQTFQNLQIIIVDDGSTDDTLAVLERIKDPRIEVIKTSRQGVSAAQNAGLKRSEGEFIAFLDADDRWLPTKLERQLQVITAEPDIVAVFANFVRFDENGIFPLDQFRFFPELATTKTEPTVAGNGRKIVGNAFSELVSFTEVPAWVQTILFRAEALKGLKFHESPPRSEKRDIEFCEDLHFCLRVYRRGAVAFIEEPMVQVRRHGENTTQNAADMPYATLAALELLGAEQLDPPQRWALLRRIGRAQIAVGLQDAEDGRGKAAFAAYMRALRASGARLSAIKNLTLLAGRSVIPRGVRRAS